MGIYVEEWRPVIGLLIDYSEYYEVSNLGRVRSLDRKCKTKNNKEKFYKGVILKNNINSRGYEMVVLSKGGVQKTETVHKLVALAWLKPCPGKYGTEKGCYNLDHIDKNKLNNSANNLRWMLMEENSDQGSRKGEEHGSSRLKEKQVIEIRNSYLSLKEIAKQYNISYIHAYNIICGNKWKHIPYPNKNDQLRKRNIKVSINS